MATAQTDSNKYITRVSAALAEHDHVYQIKELTMETRTASDAAAALNCDVAQIVKSLIFMTAIQRLPVLILVSGANRVNEKIIQQALGEKIVKADAEFTKAVTGFTIGGIPPLGHLQSITTLIDEDLLQFEELWAAAGTANSVFNLKPSDLVKMTNGKVIAVK